jgi:hypothetical protein
MRGRDVPPPAEPGTVPAATRYRSMLLDPHDFLVNNAIQGRLVYTLVGAPKHTDLVAAMPRHLDGQPQHRPGLDMLLTNSDFDPVANLDEPPIQPLLFVTLDPVQDLTASGWEKIRQAGEQVKAGFEAAEGMLEEGPDGPELIIASR